MLLTINAIIGAGIFGLPGRLYSLVGPYSLVACVVCGLFALTIVLCFAEVGSRFTETGGPYLYALQTFGPAVGFQAGWLMWLARVSSFAANLNLLLIYLGAFGIPVQTGSARILFVAGLVAVLAVINILGIRNASIVNNVFTLGKLVPLTLFCGAGLFAIHWERLALGPVPAAGSFSSAVLLLVYAFTGFEMTAVPGGEMKNPQRTLPRAMLVALGIVAVIYISIQAICIGTLPLLASSTRPLSDAGALFLGPAGATIIGVGIVISIFGNLHITVLSASRLPFALAERRQLPSVLARTNSRFHSPDVAILVTAAVMVTMALFNTFFGALAISTVARLLVYASTCAALPVLRNKPNAPAAKFIARGGPLLSVIAIVAAIWLLAHASAGEMRTLGFVALAGFAIHVVVSKRNMSGIFKARNLSG